MSDAHLRRVLVEDIPSLVACHTVAVGHSADLAPVHGSARARRPSRGATTMDEKRTAGREISGGHSFLDKRATATLLGEDHDLASDLRDKLSFKNGVMNGMKIGTTDAEVHVVPATSSSSSNNIKAAKVVVAKAALPPDEQCCSESSHDSSTTSKSDLNNGTVCNGHTVSEATSSSSIAISDTYSIYSEKSSEDSSHSFSGARPEKSSEDSSSHSFSGARFDKSSSDSHSFSGARFDKSSSDSYSFSGARPRTRNASSNNSSSLSNTTQPKSEIMDLSSSTSESLIITPEICISPVSGGVDDEFKVEYINYENELQMSSIMRLIQKDLSEPYSIYTYRYFIHNWPKLCFLAVSSGEVVGAIVCKLDVHKKVTVRGYIAMLAVDHRFRKRKIGSNLVQRAIRAMASDDADEVVLETEITNKPALRLYENLGFVRDKRLFRYYLNGVDALRLKLWLR